MDDTRNPSKADSFDEDVSQAYRMTPLERKQCSVMVVEPEPNQRQIFRDCLQELGFGSAYFAADHVAAEKIMGERPFTHVIFFAATTNMPPDAFLKKVMLHDKRTIAIASSDDPGADDVFELLRLGARGFLAKPLTLQSIDTAILMATKGERFSETILQAKSRNDAFSALVAATLDKAAIALRQSEEFLTAKRDYPKYMANLHNTVRMGQTFAKGGEEKFLDDLTEFFISLAQGPATRLGRLRKRLRHDRKPANEAERTSDSGVDGDAGNA